MSLIRVNKYEWIDPCEVAHIQHIEWDGHPSWLVIKLKSGAEVHSELSGTKKFENPCVMADRLVRAANGRS
jgi:hypothetical protein